MGEKTSNDISSESAHQICSQKFMHTALKGLYQRCIKNCEISKFGFLTFFFHFRLKRTKGDQKLQMTSCLKVRN